MAKHFELVAPFSPTGDQPQAIKRLVEGIHRGDKAQTLLGVTGSGKTFTMANVIAQFERPALIISHNKTLAAQLASEFKEFFPRNAVDYFVSYYDYYQPEAYIPRTDTYIEKDSQINDEIDRLRNAATHDLLTRRDVVIVASVSCIYGVGNPTNYEAAAIPLRVGQRVPRPDLLRQLNTALYQRNDYDFQRGTYRVRGETVDIHPAYSEEGIRLEFHNDQIEAINIFDVITGKTLDRQKETLVFPGRQFVTASDRLPQILTNIRQDLKERVSEFEKLHKPLEAERIAQRTNFDVEMLESTGITAGIENYSRYFDFRQPGQPPSTLLDYLPKDFLLFIDESHMTLPQLHAMYEGDRSRKQTLVDYGFRLPSAMDNRPLKYEEIEQRIGQCVYVSATPAPFEIKASKQVVEQLIRPTGLLDPEISIRPSKHQIDDLVAEIRAVIGKGQRVLVTTLTKRMAEDLAEYLDEAKIKTQYLHSDVDTLQRLEILRDLRLGNYDVLVGINLLREGLDLPEVSLVAILDADKEGFLRSETALMQVMGRAARHVEGRVVMYADRVTGSMQRAIDETKRRRKLQEAYNTQHGLTPTTIEKKIRDDRLAGQKREVEDVPKISADDVPPDELPFLITTLTNQMDLAAKNLEFEKAAALRDEITKLEKGLSPKARTKGGFATRGRGKNVRPGRFGKRR